MLKKKLSIGIILIIFLLIILFFLPSGNYYKVINVVSPVELVFKNKTIKIKDLDCFDSRFTPKNKDLALLFNISEEEAFVLGNLSKYWTEDLVKGRNVKLKGENDFIFLKTGYKDKFFNSGFCIKDNRLVSEKFIQQKLEEIRKGKYWVMDLETEKFYKITDNEVKNLENILIVKKYTKYFFNKKHAQKLKNSVETKIIKKDFKVILSDMTINLKPKRTCSDNICREILENINNAQKTIDLAIYGYSGVPEIEEAFRKALKRGVKIRLVYDADANGTNIYENTEQFKKILRDNISDKNSPEAGNLMHNKFYIFDDEILITGSANLSYTDMSGFNSNSVMVVKNPNLAQIYKKEFEQMYKGSFHNQKVSHEAQKINFENGSMDIYFSPQDGVISKAVLPLIMEAKNYIYIPTFVLTHPKVTEELINAKKRGVDVKIIIDALNASGKHSKHELLREGGVEVKTENYAGKMHSKSMIVDDKYTIIGSMNFSNSGDKRNDENLIVINNPEVSRFYRKFFLYQWAKIDNKWLKYNARAESKDSIGSCEDGLDNNYNGLTDKLDTACREF